MTRNEYTPRHLAPNSNPVAAPRSESANLNTLSLTKNFQDSIDYRKHSALKIRVKPRQALASVNIKLMEQRPKTAVYKPNVSYALRSCSNNCEDVNMDDYYEKALSALAKEELINGADLLGSGKDAFRPSTVRRRVNKTSTESDTTHTQPPQRVVTTAQSHVKIPIKNLNDKLFLNTKSLSPSLLASKTEPTSIKIKRNKTDMKPATVSTSKYTIDEGENVLPDLGNAKKVKRIN